MDYFTFDENKNIVPCKDVMEWAHSFENKNRRVEETFIDNKRISTMFFGTNLSGLHEMGKPLVLETMIFEEGSVIYCDRYATWQEAEEGHKRAVQWVKDGCKEDE